MRDRIVRTISNYRREKGTVIDLLDFNALAELEMSDSYYMKLAPLLPGIQNFEHLKDLMDKAQARNQLKKACEQVDNFLSKNGSFKELMKNLSEVINTELLPQISPEHCPYFFLQVLFQWDEEVGGWSATPRVLPS